MSVISGAVPTAGAIPDTKAKVESDPTTGVDRGTPTLTFGLIVLAAHLALAWLMQRFESASTAHALGTFAVGMYLAVADKRADRVACVAAYFTGADVLWRMMDSEVPYEFAKYAVVMILCTSMARRRATIAPVPLLYFAALLPSVPLAISPDVSTMRMEISFNLSGPLAITACVLFFHGAKFTRGQLVRMLLWMAAPVLSMGMLILFKIASIDQGSLRKRTSDPMLAGGYGPNQVASALALGALAALLYAMTDRCSLIMRLVMVGVATLLVGQSAMTLSRGGALTSLAAVLAAMPFFLKNPKYRTRAIVFMVAIYAGLTLYLIPRMDQFTEGRVTDRFETTHTSGRAGLMADSLGLWADNPILGVGPGRSGYHIETQDGVRGVAHTEFTRLFAEHGLFGVVSLVCLCAMIVGAFRRGHQTGNLAVAVPMLVWAVLYMFINATRLVSPAFVLGLAGAMVFHDPKALELEIARMRRRLPHFRVPPYRSYRGERESDPAVASR